MLNEQKSSFESKYRSPRKRLGSSRRARTDQALDFFFADDGASSSNEPIRFDSRVFFVAVSSSSISNGLRNNRRGKSNKLWPRQSFQDEYISKKTTRILLRSMWNRSGVNIPIFVIFAVVVVLRWRWWFFVSCVHPTTKFETKNWYQWIIELIIHWVNWCERTKEVHNII